MQPYLHDLVSCVRAPAVMLSGTDGQLRPGGAHGLLVGETRTLSEYVLTVDGAEPAPVGHQLRGASGCTFTGVLRGLGDAGADPTVRLVRERTALTGGFTERVRLRNDARVDVHAVLAVHAACDFAPIDHVKRGDSTAPVPPTAEPVRWSAAGRTLTVDAEPPPHRVELTADGALLSWDVAAAPRTEWTLTLRASTGGAPPPFPPPATTWPDPVSTRAPTRAPTGAPTGAPTVYCHSADAELNRLVARSLADLDALRLADPLHPADEFLAAGSPWYLTLFGRDSLWAARMLLPVDQRLAAGTLRTLARRQGRAVDRRTGEEPGKILHEVREVGGNGLPPVYFGTIDATPLWVCLLHDAWRWGLPAAEVADLLGPLRAALDWIVGHDGFLSYLDHTGTGLANQGWKDSFDSIQWPDGRLAHPPIALSEAQAYAHEAAVHGAAVLAAFGLDGSRHLEWAAGLRRRFRERFWVGDFPAIALDGDGRPVASAASNLGHLLGTGLLDDAETALVADRIARPDLDCGRGLRTLGAAAAGFNPLGYHAGTVWPHDTAIAVLGLARTGHGAVAASLARGLVRAASAFDHRLPELFGGTDVQDPVLAYPAACRPQAWSAAAAPALLQAALGLFPDGAAGGPPVAPDPAFAAWFPLRLTGVRFGGRRLTVEVDAHGAATTLAVPDLTRSER